MRILYIADNRNRPNWGCRATSAALSELIGQEHEVVGRISGRLTLSRDSIFNPFCDWKWNGFDSMSENFDRSIELIKKYAQENEAYEEIDLDAYRYDAILINGEGTMIMTSPSRRDTLYYLLFTYWAKKRGKKVYFMNAMFSDCPKTGRNEHTVALTRLVLSNCDVIGVRDPLSYRYAKEIIGLNACCYVPDALFTWIKYYHRENTIKNTRDILPHGYESDEQLQGMDLSSENYICVSGSSAAAWDQTKAFIAYERLVRELKKKINYPILLVEVCKGDAFLKKAARVTDTVFVPAQVPIVSGLNLLAHARLYISGRYHPSIMSSLGGTPCVFLGANSHKNMGLQEMLEYDNPKEYGACPTEQDIEEICKDAMVYMDDAAIRRRIKKVCVQIANEAERKVLEWL